MKNRMFGHHQYWKGDIIIDIEKEGQENLTYPGNINCEYFDRSRHECTNVNTKKFGKDCRDRFCECFSRRTRKKKSTSHKNGEAPCLVRKENLAKYTRIYTKPSNGKEGKVMIGDIVILKCLATGEEKKYLMTRKKNTSELTEITKKCLDKLLRSTIVYKEEKYRIIQLNR